MRALNHVPRPALRVPRLTASRTWWSMFAGLRWVVGLVAAAAVLAQPVAPVQAASGMTYYVDCSAGRDTNAGTAPAAAWRSLVKANAAALGPGDSLLLKRGCSWQGPLNARWHGTADAPVTIAAYGNGLQPRIQNADDNVVITGSDQFIRNIFTRSDPTGYDAACDNAPYGLRIGFRLKSGSYHNTIRDSTANDQFIGIEIERGSHDNRILSNTLSNNRLKHPNPASGSGGVGISLMGDDNEVAYNIISGSDMCSELYGRDGSAIEVYGGQRNRIHHNTGRENNAFTELGNSRSSDNTYAYNQATSSLPHAAFLVTRGVNDRYGPVYRTAVYNSSVYLTGSASFAIQCNGGCGPDILTFADNIVWAEDRIGHADRAFDEHDNVYWRSNGSPQIFFPTSDTSKIANPRFTNPGSGDLRLAANSPAIDVANTDAANRGFLEDLDGHLVPHGNRPDLGAHEFVGTPTPPPAPSPTPTPGHAAITLSASHRVVTWGQPVSLTVNFATAGASRLLALEASRNGADWSTVTTAQPTVTDASGAAVFTFRPSDNRYYRVTFAGAADLAAATTDAVRVVVRQIAVVRPAAATTVRSVALGTTVMFSATVRPNRPELPQPVANFVVYRQGVTGWTKVIDQRVPAARSTGVATLDVTFSGVGRYYVRAQVVPTTANANSGWTAPIWYSVR